jgi:hypothetical protein
MSNDRLFIRCDRCGAVECVGKYHPGVVGMLSPSGEDRAAEFLQRHLAGCHPGPDFGDLGPGRLWISFIGEMEYCARGGVIGGPPSWPTGNAA